MLQNRENLLGVDLLRVAECRLGLGPSGVERRVGQDLHHFVAGDAVALRDLDVRPEGGVEHP